MSQQRGPMPGVFMSNGRYFRLMRVDGKKKWIPLTRVSEGVDAMRAALESLHQIPAEPATSVRSLVRAWEKDRLPALAAKTQRDACTRNECIAQAFAEFDAHQVRTPDVVAYLREFTDRPRTYNAQRAQLRDLMRHAELLGWREPGSNPVQAVRTMRTPARFRYLTDSELRRVKLGALRGNDGELNDSGPMLCALVEVLYLTGQAVGDVLALDAADIRGDLLTFRRSKVQHSTGAAVRVRVTPRLRSALDRLLTIRARVAAELRQRRGRPAISPALIVTTQGERARYDGVHTAWRRACDRAGVQDAHIHDIKAKALTDTERVRGMRAARVMGQHATEVQTAAYVRARAAEVVDPTR